VPQASSSSLHQSDDRPNEPGLPSAVSVREILAATHRKVSDLSCASSSLNAVTGKGVEGKVDGRTAALGNARLAGSLAQVPQALTERADAMRGNARRGVPR